MSKLANAMTDSPVLMVMESHDPQRPPGRARNFDKRRTRFKRNEFNEADVRKKHIFHPVRPGRPREKTDIARRQNGSPSDYGRKSSFAPAGSAGARTPS